MKQLYNPPGLQRQISLLAVAGVTLLSLTFGALSLWLLNQSTQTILDNRLATTRLVAGTLDNVLEHHLAELTTAAADPVFGDPQRRQAVLDSLTRTTGLNVHYAFLLDASGRVLQTGPSRADLAGADFAAYPIVTQTLASGHSRISDALPLDMPGPPTVMLVVPIRDAGGRVTGVLGEVVDLMNAETLGYLRTVVTGQTGHAHVVDSAGVALAGTEPDEVGKATEHPDLYAPLIREGRAGVDTTAEYHDGEVQKEKHVMAFVPLTAVGWGVGLGQTEAETWAAARAMRAWLIGLGLSATLIAFSLSQLGVRRIVRPLAVLTAAAQRIAAGDLAAPMTAAGAGEIGLLAQSFETMRAALETRTRELSQRLRELSTLNTTAALLSQSLDMAVVLQRTLDKVLEITGMEAGEISLFDPAQGRLQIRAQRGFPDEWLAQEADRPSGCLCGYVAQQAELLDVEDISRDERTTRPACAQAGFRGFVAIPLIAEGQKLGVMSLHSRERHARTPHGHDLLTAIGNQISVALLNIRLHRETQRLAVTDGLTGLANRRAFDAHLDEEIRRARRYHRPLSLIMADIDHFKHYNDTHGHPQGDIVLQELAAVLRGAVRETDLLARYGGEEFVVILPETDKEGALNVAEKVHAAIAAHPFPLCESQPGGRLTISLGVAAFPEDLPEPVDLVMRADHALYRAKREGRDRVCGYASV